MEVWRSICAARFNPSPPDAPWITATDILFKYDAKLSVIDQMTFGADPGT